MNIFQQIGLYYNTKIKNSLFMMDAYTIIRFNPCNSEGKEQPFHAFPSVTQRNGEALIHRIHPW